MISNVCLFAAAQPEDMEEGLGFKLEESEPIDEAEINEYACMMQQLQEREDQGHVIGREEEDSRRA